MSDSKVYRYPHYYAIGYRWNTEVECDFITSCLKLYGPESSKRLLDIGCGCGRHLLELAKRGYDMTGVDLVPEMITYVNDAATKANLRVRAGVDDLHHLRLDGSFDAAYCFMDTFRFLLTNDAIRNHLRRVAELLVPGGLYLTDFWIPRQWDQVGNEVHQWEQTADETTVRVFYLQHPETIDPIAQTFEDELVFEIHEQGATQEIRGGPTRTRLILPQEFRALVESSAVFDLMATHGDFDVTTPLSPASLSWRMISVLKKR